MRGIVRTLVTLGWLALLPTMAWAQATIAGSVTDSVGAVLPGVTVEASSPVLIEKVRTVVTDGSGRYRIEDLRPGIYSVMFTLTGFAGLRRDELIVSGSAVINIDAELRVGGVQETVTVTGDTPVVDVTSIRREIALDNETMRSLPGPRSYSQLLTMVPGLQTNLNNASTGPVFAIFPIHGGRGVESRLTVDGLNVSNPPGGNQPPNYTADTGNAQEVTMTTSGGLGESETAGLVMNIVPRQGGNTLTGLFYVSGFSEGMQSNNFTDELKARGATQPTPLNRVYDFNAAVGGPIVKDRLWYYMSVRVQGQRQSTQNVYYNQNAGNPNAYTYVPDLSRLAFSDRLWENYTPRITWQATPRNKFSFSWDVQPVCRTCTGTTSLTGSPNFIFPTSPEADGHGEFSPQSVQTARWTLAGDSKAAPRSRDGHHLLPVGRSRARPEPGEGSGASGQHQPDHRAGRRHQYAVPLAEPAEQQDEGIELDRDSRVRDRLARRQDRLPGQLLAGRPRDADQHPESGVHVLRRRPQFHHPVRGPVPGERPRDADDALRPGPVDDQSPVGPGGYPLGPSLELVPGAGPACDPLLPGRHLPEDRWRDRLQRHHPAHGCRLRPVRQREDGTEGQSRQVPAGRQRQQSRVRREPVAADSGRRRRHFPPSVTRTWGDLNGNFIPDCNLTNPLAQTPATTGSVDNCGQISDLRFGSAQLIGAQFDPDGFSGWGVRPSDWAFGVSVQQELFPRAAVEVAYHHRSLTMFTTGGTVTDNLSVSPNDLAAWTLTAPRDHAPARWRRLPGWSAVQREHECVWPGEQFHHADEQGG